MPDGGWPLVRKIVSTYGLERRVIMLSGLADPRDRRAALEAGAATFLVKPPDYAKLINAVQDARTN